MGHSVTRKTERGRYRDALLTLLLGLTACERTQQAAAPSDLAGQGATREGPGAAPIQWTPETPPTARPVRVEPTLPEVSFDAPPAGRLGEASPERQLPARPQRGDEATAQRERHRAIVDVSRQELTVLIGPRTVARYPISTASRGVGSTQSSFRTPLGRHRVCEKFGTSSPLGAVFRSRVDTGQVAPILTAPVDVEEDLIMTRILWLEGLEPGLNRGAGIDSRERFIYIHGTNEEGLIGTPASHGCVRMRNRDVVDLYGLLQVGAEVEIVLGDG